MDTGSVVSEPISAHHRAFTKQKSASMTILNPKSCASAAKYANNQTNCNLESTHSNGGTMHCATTGRNRRKVASLGGGALSTRSAKSETKELRSALQDREAVIQNLRIQLCLGKLPRPTGPPLDESEKPAAEQKLQKLKAEVENKRIKIRNLKTALEKLDITDNIDTRIRQAELEYALGREELQMLSIVEEARALQARLEKAKPESQTLYSIVSSGVALSLHAIEATSGRWAAHSKPEHTGFYIEWALDGDGLYRGDRILEVNGKIISCKTKDELQKIVGNSGKCQMVVLRKKSSAIPQKQLDQEKENNLRLQHRISYLEEQVKELQSVKEQQQKHQHQHQQQHQHQHQHQPHQQKPTKSALITPQNNNTNNGHVTSISISSPPTTPPDKPLVFQRGNYITTLVGGKPIELLGEEEADKLQTPKRSNVTKTLIKENCPSNIVPAERTSAAYLPSKSLSASKISINSDSAFVQHYKREKERQRDRERYERSCGKTNALQQQRSAVLTRSVEQLHHCNGIEHRQRVSPNAGDAYNLRSRLPNDMRSVKSLEFDECDSRPNSDTRSEARSVRPMPPKKPLRLSLQRAQSLQTVELHPNMPSDASDRKRPLKRAHINDKSSPTASPFSDGNTLIENCATFHTASLGRQKSNI